MLFLDKNKQRYDWDDSNLGEYAHTEEVNPAPLNHIASNIPGINLETDNSGTSLVTPEVEQSDTERINEAKNNIFLIPGGNNIRSVGVVALVYDTPLGGGNPIDASQGCVLPKE